MFLAQGYGAISIEAIAERARISKRTLYDRFEDKPAVFAAVVHAIVDEIRPSPDVPLIAGTTLAEIFGRLAHFMLNAALAPQALALHRLVGAESARFPELARAVAGDAGNQEAIDLIAGLLAREFPASTSDDREFAAEQFIHMVVTVPRRRALGYGRPMTAAQVNAWASKVVGLFLEGFRGMSS